VVQYEVKELDSGRLVWAGSVGNNNANANSNNNLNNNNGRLFGIGKSPCWDTLFFYKQFLISELELV